MATDGVLDASLLLNLGGASALDLLWNDPRHRWHITPITRSEVASDPTRTAVAHAILNGRLRPTELDTRSVSELTALALWTRYVDPGEAEAIAIATSRGWVVGIEDLAAQRRLTREEGSQHWINAAGLLVAAVRAGRLPLPAADAIFARLDCYSGYRKRGIASLSDLAEFGTGRNP
jgi:hypothetical protein